MSHLKYISFPGEQPLGLPFLCLQVPLCHGACKLLPTADSNADHRQTSLISHALVFLLSYTSFVYTVNSRSCGGWWQLVELNKAGMNLDWDS